MDAVVFVNGTIRPAADAVISVFDHGFLYGEGVYETMRTYERAPFLLDRHLARLRRSAALMRLPLPFSDGEIGGDIERTMAERPDWGECYIRVLVTRGVGDLSYDPSVTPTPSVVIIVKPLVLPPERSFSDGVAVAVVDVRRNHPQALNPLMKSNNLLNNALAAQDAYARGADEALMLNHAGELAEGSQTNVFVVKDGGVWTPPLSAGLLPGITREFVLELAAEAGYPGGERTLTPEDVARADELFLTGTTREITPVARVDGTPVASGRPGRITLALLERFRARVRELAPEPRV
ncbi:MAG: aminotransferase class IV [Acidobacteria bacterium]|nr:aminotransferase class IV [Acidobacteriota bacterium]